MSDFKKQIKKGVLELAILKLLDEEDQYGYSIIQQVSKRSNNTLEVKDGTLYPILYRLEDNEIIKSYWQNNEGGRSRPRKYYKITQKGKTTLKSMLTDYFEVNNSINMILGGDEKYE